MNKKKIIATASAVALAAMLAFGGTLAYYQGQAETPVENTLVDQGNSVSISETDVDSDGSTQSNTYSIIPGTTDTKDPVVTAEYTLDSYVYVTVDDTTGDLITWDPASAWTKLDGYDNVYYLLLKTVSYDETSSEWAETSTGSGEYAYTEDGLTYTYKGTSDDVGSYTVSKDGVQIYTYKTETAGSTTLYTASIPVIDGDTITYSSEITNETFTGYGTTVSLDFKAYIIQAWLGGTDSYGESVYAGADDAFLQVYYDAAVENGNVAAIGMNVYKTLQEAITAAEAGETVTLLADMELTNSTIRVEADQEISLDLGGNTITVTEAEAGRVALYNAGTITSLTNGSIVLESLETANSNVAYVVYNLGTIGELNIDANGGAWTVYVGGTGTIEKITGGTYINNLKTNVAGFGLYITTNAKVGEISGGEFQGTKAAVANYGSIGTISGGLFHGRYYDGETVTTLLPQYTIMYSGKISTITGGTFFKGSTNIAQNMTTFNSALEAGSASLVQTDDTATIVYKKSATATTTITYTGYYYKVVPNE